MPAKSSPRARRSVKPTADHVAAMIELARQTTADCQAADARAAAALTSAQLGTLRAAPVPPVPAAGLSEPEIAAAALAFDRMHRLAELMRQRGVGPHSALAYANAANEALATLWFEVKQFSAAADDMAHELGMRLHVLKRRKPVALTWGAYLKDSGCPFGKSRADEYISVFLGKTTVLKLREKDAAKKRQTRAKAAGSPGRSAVETTGENGSACAINWEDHREDESETDAQVRARAIAWQLHEATRLADEFALRRPGTQRSEISLTTIRKVGAVIAAWRRLQRDLRKKLNL